MAARNSFRVRIFEWALKRAKREKQSWGPRVALVRETRPIDKTTNKSNQPIKSINPNISLVFFTSLVGAVPGLALKRQEFYLAPCTVYLFADCFWSVEPDIRW